MLAWVLRQPVALAAAIPALGLTVAVLVARLPGHADTATTDAYVRTYHERGGTMRVQDLWAKLLECAATLGSAARSATKDPRCSAARPSAPGPRVDCCSASDKTTRRCSWWRAPRPASRPCSRATHRHRLRARGSLHAGPRRRALLPALVAASTSYLTYVALLGTGRIFEVSGGAAFDLRDLLGGFVVGLLCGTLARAGAWAIAHAKHLEVPVAVRVAGAGVRAVRARPRFPRVVRHSPQSRIRLRGHRLGATTSDRARPAHCPLLRAVRGDVVHGCRWRCRRPLHSARHPRRARRAHRPSHRPRAECGPLSHRRYRGVPRGRLPNSTRRRLVRRRSDRTTRVRRSRAARRGRVATGHGPLVLQRPTNATNDARTSSRSSSSRSRP